MLRAFVNAAKWLVYALGDYPPAIPGRQPASITYYENTPRGADTPGASTQRRRDSHEHDAA